MRTLACFHVVKPCLWNSDHEWKISICRQFPNSISSHVCTRLRCYIVAYKHCDLFCWETSYFPWRNQQETLKNSLKIRVFIVRRKKIKFKKCARAILDSDDKMPSCWLKHENEAEGHGPTASFSCLSLFPHLLVKIQNSFYACVDEGCSGPLTIACEPLYLRWS